MKTLILQSLKERDAAFIKNFCTEGNFMGNDGEQTMFVCRPMNADEVLNFMHTWDAVLLENVKASDIADAQTLHEANSKMQRPFALKT